MLLVIVLESAILTLMKVKEMEMLALSCFLVVQD